MRTKTTWILVADGAHGRIYQHRNTEPGLEPVPDGEFSQEMHRNREIGADRPGHVQESANAAHHAVTPKVDWHRQEKESFAHRLADAVEAAAKRKAFDGLVLVAPPRVMGDLRAALGREAKERLAGELEKDLIKHGLKEIEARLAEAALI